MGEKQSSRPVRGKVTSHSHKVVPSLEESSVKVISQIVVPTIRRENAVVLTESDWRRIQIAFEELNPIAQIYQISGSILAGACISFLCLCCSFLVSEIPVARWLWILGISAVCTSGITSRACFFFHARLDAVRKHRQRSLSIELDLIKARFMEIIETANE